MSKPKKKTFVPLLGQVLKKIAPRIGAKVVLEPKWNIVGQVVFKNGRKRYFRYSSLDLNPLGASEVAKDKDYANFFMAKMGYPIIPGSKTFYKKEWAQAIGEPQRNIDAAYLYAKKIVKPNSGSQGSGVALARNRAEFYRAMRTIFKNDRVALVQRRVEGRDYRLVVLDQKIISVYERLPLSIIGDGRSTVKRLMEFKQKQFIASSRDTVLKFSDPRVREKLRQYQMDLNSIPKKGQHVHLLDNANLSTGGDSVDVSDTVHPGFKKLAIKLTKDMGLRLCGVDLMIKGNINAKPDTFWVLEINSAPGLDHYAKSGKVQEEIVDNLYLEVLKSMEKSG